MASQSGDEEEHRPKVSREGNGAVISLVRKEKGNRSASTPEGCIEGRTAGKKLIGILGRGSPGGLSSPTPGRHKTPENGRLPGLGKRIGERRRGDPDYQWA